MLSSSPSTAATAAAEASTATATAVAPPLPVLEDCTSIIDPESSVPFNANDTYSDAMTTPFQRIVSASAGALITSLVVTPFDVIKTRMQVQMIEDFTTPISNNMLSSPVTNKIPERLNIYRSSNNNNNNNNKAAANTNSNTRNFTEISVNSSSSLSNLAVDKTTTVKYPLNTRINNTNGIQDRVAISLKYPSPSLSLSLSQQQSPSRHTNLKFTHSLDAAIRISRYEGISHLYTGLSVTLYMAIPATVLYFSTYDILKNKLLTMIEESKSLSMMQTSPIISNSKPLLLTTNPSNTGYYHNDHNNNNNNNSDTNNYYINNAKNNNNTNNNRWNTLIPLFCGISARTFAVCVISPLELLRTQMQARTIDRNLSVYQATLLNIRAEGFLSLWKGVIPTLWRDVPFSGIYWMGYELLKEHFQKKWQTKRYNNSNSTNSTLTLHEIFKVGFISGAISGGIASIITHPFDVLKTRRQSILIGIGAIENDHNPQESYKQRKAQASFRNSLRIILKTNGPSGLFAGITARLAKVPLACAIMISVYEAGKLAFNKKQE